MKSSFANGTARRIVLDHLSAWPGGEAPESAPAPTVPDSRTTSYVLASQEPFNTLRQTSSQFAGLLLLAAIGSRAVIDLPQLTLAREAVKEAGDRIRSLVVTAHAAHHYRHLMESLTAIEQVACADWHRLAEDDGTGERIGAGVRAAIDHLRRASFALPGYEMTAMSDCCAVACRT